MFLRLNNYEFEDMWEHNGLHNSVIKCQQRSASWFLEPIIETNFFLHIFLAYVKSRKNSQNKSCLSHTTNEERTLTIRLSESKTEYLNEKEQKRKKENK